MSFSFANIHNLDLLIFNSIYSVIIYKLYKYTIILREITSYLRTYHQADGSLTSH
jgi:hypothetical protein